jgi:hypothetical protein
MKYLPLVWAAFRRHTTESLLTFVVLTVAFTLFSAMVSLRAAYDHAIEVHRMDRLISVLASVVPDSTSPAAPRSSAFPACGASG